MNSSNSPGLEDPWNSSHLLFDIGDELEGDPEIELSCPRCKGSGLDRDEIDCLNCDGNGTVFEWRFPGKNARRSSH